MISLSSKDLELQQQKSFSSKHQNIQDKEVTNTFSESKQLHQTQSNTSKYCFLLKYIICLGGILLLILIFQKQIQENVELKKTLVEQQLGEVKKQLLKLQKKMEDNQKEKEYLLIKAQNKQIEHDLLFHNKFAKKNYLNGLKFHAGEIHYNRIPEQYWQHRILMVKAMGLNALSVYVMWNYHEIERGEFDYSTGNRNLTKFLGLAQTHKMMVLIRPGPYVCAEWDFGGLPARLLSIPNLQIREYNMQYLIEVSLYMSSLASILQPYLYINGGPIILLQIENELASYQTLRYQQYNAFLMEKWVDLGLDVEFYYEDAYLKWNQNYADGLNVGLSVHQTEGKVVDLIMIEDIMNKTVLAFGGELYSGWITHWEENWVGREVKQFINQTQQHMRSNKSFSMYMVHGGTNFGLTAGANHGNITKGYDYRAHVTRYYHDCPISQNGLPNQKYFIMRELAKKYVLWPIPNIPEPIKTITIPAFPLEKKCAILPQEFPLPKIINSQKIYSFESDELEMFEQGFVLYSTFLPVTNQTIKYEIIVHDYAKVWLDQTQIAIPNRSYKTIHEIQIFCKSNNTERGCLLEIMVEAMGHINFHNDMSKDRKGLIQFHKKDSTENSNLLWKMTTIPIDERHQSKILNTQCKLINILVNYHYPHIFAAEINLNEVGDTFLEMGQFSKGYVWVNGHNLGRYWNRGPQYRLYCPGVWLKKGKNLIQVLDWHLKAGKKIRGEKQMR